MTHLQPVTIETVRQIAQQFPGVEEYLYFGTPAFRVRKKFLSRLKEDGESLVMRVNDPLEKDVLLQSEPETFYITDHYVGYPYVLIRLASVDRAELQRLFENAWRDAAPKRLIAAYDNPT